VQEITMKTRITLVICVALAGVAVAKEEPAAPQANLIANGSFEVGTTGWMLVENNVAGTKWGAVEGDVPHGNHALCVDYRGATAYPPPSGFSRVQGSWFEHGETALFLSAMVKSDAERKISLGFTHGEIGRVGKRGSALEKAVAVGPEWRRVFMHIPRSMNLPKKGDFGARNVIDRASHTKGMVYFEFPAEGVFHLDAVQVVEMPQGAGGEPPPFVPARDVELGWTMEHGGFFHEQPGFSALVANQGDDPWTGRLHARVVDYWGRTVQDDKESVTVAPGKTETVPFDLEGRAYGFFEAVLTLTGSDGSPVAESALTLVQTPEGAGSDHIAITAGVSSSDNLVNAPRSLKRLGFTQTRTYNVADMVQLEPKRGQWQDPAPLMKAFLGDSGLKTQINFAKLPKWLIGPEAEIFAYPLKDLPAYSNYVRRAIAALRPYLSAVAFANEPNAHFVGTPATYVAYLQELHDVAKSEAPEADVVGIQAGSGSQGGGHILYVREMMEVGGRELAGAMDVLAIQSHPAAEMPFEITGWERILAQFREIARQHGIKRIWTTEMCHTAYLPRESHLPVRSWAQNLKEVDFVPTERNQADWLTRAALYSLASTFERFYAFHYPPVSPHTGGLWPWGMTRVNHLQTPRPVLAALAVANRMIAGTNRRQPLPFLTPGLWGASFTGNGRRVDAVWSAIGPQNVLMDKEAGVFDAMGNPVSLPDGGWIELGESPVYVVSSDTGSRPVSEVLSVGWDPESVWSGGPLQGRITIDPEGGDAVRAARLQVVRDDTGEIVWEQSPEDRNPEDGSAPAWSFPLDVPPGPLALTLKADIGNGQTLHRRFVPMVLGAQPDRAVYSSGKPNLVEDFAKIETNAWKGRSPRGINWSAELTFPWFNIYGTDADRSLTHHDGFVRTTINEKLGKPVRGKPGWPAVDAIFDEPRNWLAYRGLRIRYRMDRGTDGGGLVMDPVLSAEGIGICLVDDKGNTFFTNAGHPGTRYFRDGDWYVAELDFDEVLALNEKRARIRSLSLVSSAPGDDANPFGLSIGRIEAFIERAKPGADDSGVLPKQPTFDE
jgi:hypothetical protein